MSNIFESKNIPKVILQIGIPAMLGQLATLIYNIADTYFVSLTRESAQIAAVTLSTPVLLIIMSIACVFGMGGSSVIARLIGENKKEDVAKCFSFSTYAMFLSSIVVSFFGLLFIEQIANIIGADTTNFEYTCDYLRWIFIGSAAIMLSNGFVHSFRSLGLIKEATIGLVIGNGVNIVFDWIFVVSLKMGVAGAAMATSLGFVCSTVYYIACLISQEKRGNELIQMSLKKFSVRKELIVNVIKIGIPGALITVLMSVSNIVLNNYIGIYGSDAVASYGIAYKIDMFPIMLSVGLAQGTAPLLGYYYGKKDNHSLSKSMRIGTIYGIILGAVFAFTIFFSAKVLAGIFLEDEKLITLTALFLQLLCFHAPLLGIINIVTSYFQALGKAFNSLLITVLRNIVLFIPGAVILNNFIGLNGVILTQLVVEMVLAIICIFMYFENKPIKLIPYQSKVLKLE